MSVPNKLELRRNQSYNETYKKYLSELDITASKTAFSIETLANYSNESNETKKEVADKQEDTSN